MKLSFDTVTDRLVHSPKRVHRVYVWHVTKAKIYVTGKKQLEDIRDSWIYEKVRLKVAKSISGTWILLAFEREMRTQPPYLPSKGTLPQLSISVHLVLNRVLQPNDKTDVLKIITFLPASDALFGSRLVFNKVILCAVITTSFSTRWEQRNLE